MKKTNFYYCLSKLLLLFALLFIFSLGAKANDVYYEQCSSLNDIVAGQTYLIVISDGKSHYALRANAKNGSAITMESDKKIKNPDASFIWTTSAGSSPNQFYFSNGTYYIYNDYDAKTTTLTCNSTKKSICYISKLESTNAFKITLNKPTGRYIGWKNENTFYAYGAGFFDHLADNTIVYEKSGALYIYKKVSGPTLSSTVTSLDLVTSEVGSSDSKSFNITGANLTSSATITISGKDANMFSATPSVIEATDGTISSKEVLVSYNPSTTGTHSAVLTISSSDATPVAVDLKGRVAGKHNITWKVNGSTYSVGSPTTVVADGEKVAQLPTPPSDVEDNKFVGWTTTEITSKQSSAPSVLFTSASDAPIVTSDAVYYAVYASQDGPATWKKLKVYDVKEEGVYALITSGGYAFSGNIEDGKSYFCKTQFSFNNSNIATSAPEDVCELTLKKSGDGFSMYNAKYGYLYAKKNAVENLAWQESEPSYWYYYNAGWCYKANDAYLRAYSVTSANGYFNTCYNKSQADVYFAQKISSASYTTTLGATPTYTAKAISLKAETADAHWATFSYSEPTFFPETVAVNAITVAEGTITTNNDVFEHSSAVTIGEATLSGVYVPANTGVLIKSADADATCYVVANKTVAALQESQNMLKPALVGGGVFSAENDYTYYKLAYNDFSSRTGLGFYYGADAGGAFYVKAETAYLAVPTAMSEGAKAFVLDGETTAINGISTRNNHAEAVYNLNGQRVASMAKPGMYIVNGKKVVRK
jgi:hypothetical protein